MSSSDRSSSSPPVALPPLPPFPRVPKACFRTDELEGQLGTHAMRKTFAGRVYQLLGRDLVRTQRALGHVNINSTVAYLSFALEEIDQAILAQ